MPRFTKDQLAKLGLTEDSTGNFSKPKVSIKNVDYKNADGKTVTIRQERSTFGDKGKKKETRSIILTLFGEPMPKQSVRSGVSKKGKIFHYQPQEMVDREADYRRQILEQLPEDWQMFEHEVHLKKFHCIFSPLKGFHKIKGRMEAIRNGEIFYKNTKPDLIDNLKKLAFDSMSGLVCKDDSIIVTENDTAKYYGIGGCIIIVLEGY